MLSQAKRAVWLQKYVAGGRQIFPAAGLRGTVAANERIPDRYDYMNITPTEIRRLETRGLRIKWSDGISTEVSSKVLRTNCPCATCREARGDDSHAKPLTATNGPTKKSLLRVVENSIEEELSLQELWGVGTYAVGMSWADGHATGIYTFELLFALARANEHGKQQGALSPAE